jgi:hypothetical protein
MRRNWLTALAALFAMLGPLAVSAEAPPQRLPSAVLIWPLIVVEGGGAVTDTRIELVNLSSRPVSLGCLFVTSTNCNSIDFQIRLTPNQPLSWLASDGVFNGQSAVPPFNQPGELKCIVHPDEDSVAAHNAIQGRAAVFGADGQTIGYSAVGFLRLTDGPLTTQISLDGVTYTQCPDQQHFVFVATTDTSDPATESELVIAPCSEDLRIRLRRRPLYSSKSSTSSRSSSPPRRPRPVRCGAGSLRSATSSRVTCSAPTLATSSCGAPGCRYSRC